MNDKFPCSCHIGPGVYCYHHETTAPSYSDAVTQLRGLEAMLNTPMTDNFFEAVRYEAAHQQQRWGTKGDAGKSPADWFWLLGYLAGKSVASFNAGDKAKGLHHIISSAAALLNWHRYATGELGEMRPGIEAPHDPAS